MNQQLNPPRERPKGLREVAILISLSTLSTFLFIDGTMFGNRMADLAWTVVYVAISLFILWYFWQGRNWARILMLLGSVLSFIFVFVPEEEPRLQTRAETAMYIVDLLTSAFLLYWLNTKPVKEFFKQPREQKPFDPNSPPIPEP